MTSRIVLRLKEEGYQTTGLILNDWKDKAEIEAKADEYRVMGNKVRVVLDVQKSQFRDRTDTSRYWIVMVRYSDEWKADQKAKLETARKAEHESRLMLLAGELSMDDILFILKFKMAGMAPYPRGTYALMDFESPVKVLASNPASNGRKGYDYSVEFKDGHTAWIHEDDLGFEDEHGNPIKPE